MVGARDVPHHVVSTANAAAAAAAAAQCPSAPIHGYIYFYTERAQHAFTEAEAAANEA